MRIFFGVLGVLAIIALLFITVVENGWYAISNPFRKVKKAIRWDLVGEIDDIEHDDTENFYHT